jgi:hypothetical protein
MQKLKLRPIFILLNIAALIGLFYSFDNPVPALIKAAIYIAPIITIIYFTKWSRPKS